MAYYKLTQGKLTDIEKILSEVKPYELKAVTKTIFDNNIQEIIKHYYNLFGGKCVLYRGILEYTKAHATKDAENLLKICNTQTTTELYHCIKDKPLFTASWLLDNEAEIDFITAYKAKETLYKIQSYITGYKLGYTDVTLTYPELKDLEYVLGLYEQGDLFDLVSKYTQP